MPPESLSCAPLKESRQLKRGVSSLESPFFFKDVSSDGRPKPKPFEEKVAKHFKLNSSNNFLPTFKPLYL